MTAATLPATRSAAFVAAPCTAVSVHVPRACLGSAQRRPCRCGGRARCLAASGNRRVPAFATSFTSGAQAPHSWSQHGCAFTALPPRRAHGGRACAPASVGHARFRSPLYSERQRRRGGGGLSSRRRPSQQLCMGVFGLGWPELLVIAAVGLLIWGPSRVSSLGRNLGSLAGGLKKASSEFKDAMDESLSDAERDAAKKKEEVESAPEEFKESFDEAMKRAEREKNK